MEANRDWTKEEFDEVRGGYTEEELQEKYGDEWIEKIDQMIRHNRVDVREKKKSRCILCLLPKDHPLNKGYVITRIQFAGERKKSPDDPSTQEKDKAPKEPPKAQ